MSKEKSNSMKQLKYSIALPLATVTMFLASCVSLGEDTREGKLYRIGYSADTKIGFGKVTVA